MMARYHAVLRFKIIVTLYQLSPPGILSAKKYRKLKTLFLPVLDITATKVQLKKLNIKTQLKKNVFTP